MTKRAPGAPSAGAEFLVLARALLCGAALGCGLRWGVLAWFALFPVFLSVERPSRGKSFLVGLAAGVGFHAAVFTWLYSAFRLSGAGAASSISIWLGIAVFGGCHWGLLWLLGEPGISRLPEAARPWAWAVLWTAGMSAWERWLPWLNVDLAYTQVRFVPLLQLAPLFGAQVFGYLIVASNAALAQAWEKRRGGRANAAILAALLAGAWLYGRAVLARRTEPARTARIEILHTGTAPRRRWDANYVAWIENGFDELLARPRPKPPAMIFWPEGSIPRWVADDETIPEAAAWSRRLGAYQLVGAYADKGGLKTNSVFAIAPDGRLDRIYRQRTLIPLLEAVPDSPFLRRLFGSGDNPLVIPLQAGDAAQRLLDTPLGPFGVSICFESTAPAQARADARRGARLLFEASNDSWFPGTWEPEEHLAVAIVRAAENRMTVVRASNGGVSAVIDPWGVTTARLEPERRGRLDADLDVRDEFPERSFYTRRGDLLGAACMALAAGLVLLANRRRTC